MSVAVAVELPTMRVDQPEEFLTAEAVGQIARAAEDAGYAACFVTDHPAGDARWLDTGGHLPPAELRDVTMDALLDHFTKLAGYTWEVDRFGILFFKAPKK